MRTKAIISISVFVISCLSLFAQQLPEKLAKEIDENLTQAKQFENTKDFNQAAYFYNKAATVYWVNGHPSKAVELFLKAVEMNTQIGNLNAIRTLYNYIGMVYTDEEEYEKALEYFNKTLDVSRKLNRKNEIATSLVNIANAQVELKKYTEASKTLLEANTLARELNDAKLLRDSYSLLSEVFKKLGDDKKSSEYFDYYTAITRKIQQDEARRKEAEAQKMVESAKTKITEAEAQKEATERELQVKKQELIETEQSLEAIEQISRERQMQIDLLNKEQELKDAVIKNQRMFRNIFVVITIAVLAFAASIFYSLNQKKKANILLSKQNKEIAAQKDLIDLVNKDLEIAFNQIEKQNRDITSSINYAQRIQQAMLPTEDCLTAILPESFIMLRPRDIVSGDFYWFTGYASPARLKENPRSNYIKLHNICDTDSGLLITAVDCTGHGVPGAFMSMIGFNLLDTITRGGITSPNLIMNDLHRYVRYLLKQQTTDNQDGMDMSFCHIKNKGKLVQFAGARNPLYYISNNELTHLKSDSVPIGGMQKEDKREFTIHNIDVSEPTTFYMFSDGYIDQFGGLHGQKYSSRRFKELLLEIHKLPMDKQKEILEQKMDEWIGNGRKQIDDILVIGFKLSGNEIDI